MTLVAAMGQMFYSLSIAMGILYTYGSYTDKDMDLEQSTTQIEIFDTGIAILAGLMIIPAVFSFSGGNPENLQAGPSLMFITLPKVFASMGIGTAAGILFFVLVLLAALSSAVSLMETCVSTFADEFHWKDGIGPKESRKKMINTNWGGVVEDNSFGTHEFFELCRQIGCETYINGNMGSGTVQEMSEWVEYMTFDGVSPMADLRAENGHEKPWTVDFFGIGNENWGCGGNMNPEFYGNMYRRYQTFVRDYDGNKKIRKIACGANSDDYEWTQEVMKACFRRISPQQHGMMDGLSLHYYTVPETWDHKGSATEFAEKDWYKTMKKTMYMEELIRRHSAIMDQYDPDKKVGMIVDEWGTWYDVEPGTNPGFLYQQNTMRDALVAGINLNLFNKHSDRVKMANIAQMVNVLQSMILTEGEKMVNPPTYHVFDLYQVHQENDLLASSLETEQVGLEDEYMVPNLTESVSVDADGVLHITMTNVDLEKAYPVEAVLLGKEAGEIKAEIVTGHMQDKNTFEEPETVGVQGFDGVQATKEGISFTIPACSVLHIAVK